MPFQTITRADLTAVEEENLVRIVRGTERAEVADSNGNTVTRYFPTPREEDALSRLVSAYINDIRRAARTAKVLSREDAEMVATEKFITLARSETRRTHADERLAGFVSRAMVNAVMDADAEASAIRIPPDTLRRYFNLVKECGSVEAAFVKCKNEANNFDPITLLAVHRSINAVSIDDLSTDDDGNARDGDFTDADAVHAFGAAPGPEEQVVQADLVDWFFTLVPDDQELVLRLAYGFSDTRSEALRVKAGYQYDTPLSDAQISPVVARSRASVQRARTDALRVMHAAALAIAIHG